MKLMRAMSLQGGGGGEGGAGAAAEGEVTRDNSIQFGAAELAGFRVQLNVVLQVLLPLL